ncbi:glycerophosphoryl diester phosphodiesterase [Quadrisphaera granulorum]|uniref:glycerophosphodiester phosphodiesterase n=1 Tax=Quadrisphaera granulorum TaxID=317664 RepID=A0A316AD92_9ACTN|nr:glycerophosphodiester phosphodiesterase family protein [Quadrisphaera granulorum]PWJ55379.1 glycerophosphoryl diester phosphodiesterase [Quadrisphaera granulorum]SZE95443.1 glycerophosphoryl diester phosphodiesterase [Quadrisphaera granulorum]
MSRADGRRPVVIGHRGASVRRPEHTRAAYELAVADGADGVDVDLVATADGELVVRHEAELSDTTDVADHPELAHLRTTRVVDGVSLTGWFSQDLTLAQVRTLRARERLPDLRPESAAHNGEQAIMTFAEVLALREELSARAGWPVAVWPELKHPGHFAAAGLALEPRLLAALEAFGLVGDDDGGSGGRSAAGAVVVVQCFEVAPLRRLRAAVPSLRLAQLTQPTGAPPDLRLAGDHRDYADLCTPSGLRELRGWADVLAPHLVQVEPRDARGLSSRSRLVDDAHAAGLAVVPYTVRPENTFLPAELRSGGPRGDLAARGDVAALLRQLREDGVDGVFTDDPAAAREALD